MILDVRITSWWMHLGTRLERMPARHPRGQCRGLTVVGTTHLDREDCRAYAHVALQEGLSEAARAADCAGFISTSRTGDVILDAHLGLDPTLWAEIGAWLRATPGVAYIKLWLADGSRFEADHPLPVQDFEFQLEYRPDGKR